MNFPIFANVVIIILIGIIGVVIAFLSLNIFTHHGAWDTVPDVENMSYTDAIKNLRKAGFRTDIRDSIYNEEITPGFVVEQFPRPGSHVKPGRKIFLYINAVHPRELIIDSDNSTIGPALSGFSKRQGLAKLEELGFKNVSVVTLPGESDRVIRVLANGRQVAKMQKIPINAKIILEVYDGSYRTKVDSLLDEEYLEYVMEQEEGGEGVDYDGSDYEYSVESGDDGNATSHENSDVSEEPEIIE